MNNEEMITEKQYWYIKKELVPKWNIDLNEARKLTKDEASRIIKTNIIDNCPLLQWFVWKEKGNDTLYINTCENANNIMCDRLLGKIQIEPKLFLKKRFAEEFYQQKIERRSPKDLIFIDIDSIKWSSRR